LAREKVVEPVIEACKAFPRHPALKTLEKGPVVGDEQNVQRGKEQRRVDRREIGFHRRLVSGVYQQNDDEVNEV
jgi:hypothetical protein